MQLDVFQPHTYSYQLITAWNGTDHGNGKAIIGFDDLNSENGQWNMDPVSFTNYGGSETRPTNAYVNYLIKTENG